MSDENNTAEDSAAASASTPRNLVGLVVSDKMDKTITVLVERRVKHPLYKKYVRRQTKFHAHDEENTCNVGDTVSIEQCRPISKSKAWRLLQVVERAR